MRYIFIISLILSFFVNNSFVFAGDNQLEIAKRYSNEGRSPVKILNPENGKEIGYILYSDLDEDGKSEIIIPYKIKKSEVEIENSASPYRQILTIDIVKDNEIIRDFIKVELAYSYTPKPYIITKKIPENELPKVFLLINDGVSKEKGPDCKYDLIFKSMDKKNFDIRKFETVKMPWKFILYQFSEVPTVNEFFTLSKEGKGVFYVRILRKEDKWPKIPLSKIDEFIKELKNFKPQINWQYGPSATGIKP